MERDFKGVWIPKEIWLSKELSILEKVLLTEISSLDNENHCTASNDYFAQFFDCSVRTISRAVAHLKELGYIEELPFNGKCRILRVDKMSMQGRQIGDTPSTNCPPSNIDNKLDNNIDSISTNVEIQKPEVTKSLLRSIPKTSQSKEKKKSLYVQCMEQIESFTDNKDMRELLTTYLRVRLDMKDYNLYPNQWKGYMNELRRLVESGQDMQEVVQQSINRGYRGFFPVKNYNNKRRLL